LLVKFEMCALNFICINRCCICNRHDLWGLYSWGRAWEFGTEINITHV